MPRNGSEKKRVRIYVYVCQGGNPEKYTILYITRGNGSYTSRWGHLIDIQMFIYTKKVAYIVEKTIHFVARIDSINQHIHVEYV